MLLIIMLNKASHYTQNEITCSFPVLLSFSLAKWQAPARDNLISLAKTCIAKDKSLHVLQDPFIWFLTKSIIPLFTPLLDHFLSTGQSMSQLS